MIVLADTNILLDVLVTRDARDFDAMGVRSVTAVELLAVLLSRP